MRSIDPAAPPPLWLIALLASVTATGPFAMQILVPALPAIQAAMATSVAATQLTLSASMIAIAVATLIYGPVSDRYGRRPVLLFGMAMFIVGSIGCTFPADIHTLVTARIVQAAGGAAGLVLARAVARDHYGPQRAAAVIARLTMVMVIAPMLAPVIGGVIVDLAGWRTMFACVGAAGVVVLVAVLTLFGESHRAEDHMESPAGMLRGFAQLLSSGRFIALMLYPAFSSTIFFTFISGAPYVMVVLLERPASEYGVYFMFVVGGFMLGNFASVKLSERIGTLRLMTAGMLIALGGVGSCIALVAAGELSPLTLFAPMVIAQIGQGMGLPNAQAEVMHVFPLRAGTASALSSFSQMVFAAIASQSVGVLQNGTAWPMLVIMLVGVMGALTAVTTARTMRQS
jgi:DHA1 family bicyclomycin/chloramphenicol resistance-like MFS transporter